MTLRYVKAEGLNAKASQNVSHAIEVFELFRKQESSDFFWAEIDLRGLQGSKFLIYFLQHFSTLIPSRKREEIFRTFIILRDMCVQEKSYPFPLLFCKTPS